MSPSIEFEQWPQYPWLDARTILLTVHGSRAYGLNRAGSDTDVKGIALPPPEVLHGFLHTFDQAESRSPVDCVIFDVRKFCKLAAEANPNIIEILFTAPRHWIRSSPQHELLWKNRTAFLSRKARHTFAGYAQAQLKRIEGHYRWLKNPPQRKPSRAGFGLPEGPMIPKDNRDVLEGLIKNRLASWRLDLEPLDEASKIQLEAKLEEILLEIGIAHRDDLWEKAGRSLGIGDNLMELLKAERAYKSKCDEWDAYQDWQANRNPHRHALEAKFGYDTKHAMHLVRLQRMAGEILRTGEVIVERPDRDELLAIRDGAWTYQALIDWSRQQDAELEAGYKLSPLPKEPDRNAIDALCRQVIESML